MNNSTLNDWSCLLSSLSKVLVLYGAWACGLLETSVFVEPYLILGLSAVPSTKTEFSANLEFTESSCLLVGMASPSHRHY